MGSRTKVKGRKRESWERKGRTGKSGLKEYYVAENGTMKKKLNARNTEVQGWRKWSPFHLSSLQ